MSNNYLFIRTAATGDLEQCLTIDHSYQTNRVWQMSYSQNNGAASVRFQIVRLPRSSSIAYPHSPSQLIRRWNEAQHFLVAEERHSQICAYIALSIDRVGSVVWISDMAVAPSQRRQGVGSQLLTAARQWARRERARQMMVSLPTKNYPGIQFCKKHGFGFCGYNEYWYPSGEIALFFCTQL